MWRGFTQLCFSYWGVFLCVPSPNKPEICTGRIKEELSASGDCIITPFLWAWCCLYLRPQILHRFCLHPVLSALDATLCRGLMQLILADCSSNPICFLPHQREEVCFRLSLDLHVSFFLVLCSVFFGDPPKSFCCVHHLLTCGTKGN